MAVGRNDTRKRFIRVLITFLAMSTFAVGDYVKITGGTYKGRQGKVKRFAGKVSVEILLETTKTSVKLRVWNVRKINVDTKEDTTESRLAERLVATKKKQQVTNVVYDKSDEPVTLLEMADTLRSINERLTTLETKLERLSLTTTTNGNYIGTSLK